MQAVTPEPKGKLDADDSTRGRDSDGGCRGERTGGRFPGLGPGGLGPGRGERTAAAAADLRGIEGRGPERVRNLQKLMLRSLSSALVSVRRVTEVNAGR